MISHAKCTSKAFWELLKNRLNPEPHHDLLRICGGEAYHSAKLHKTLQIILTQTHWEPLLYTMHLLSLLSTRKRRLELSLASHAKPDQLLLITNGSNKSQ